MKNILALILLYLLLIFVNPEDVTPLQDACNCDQLMSQYDCKANPTCHWTVTTFLCSKKTNDNSTSTNQTANTNTNTNTPSSSVSTSTDTSTTQITESTYSAYCSTFTNQGIICASTIGCAYLKSQCTHFAGCSAYAKTTNSDCQAISIQCIAGDSQCQNAKSCIEYKTQSECQSNPSVSGIKKCKWDNEACRDYLCNDASSTMITNDACNSWIAGCVTTGKGCTQTLGDCASYSGNDIICNGLKGTDGNCEGTPTGTNCQARTCEGADNTISTDNDCFAYQIGCVTNGKGCVTPPLPACENIQISSSDPSGDNLTCDGYIGSDGICEGDVGAANCRARICTNAPPTNNTDALCAAYKVGCVTTGQGCIDTLGACASYVGTTTSCVGYIGTDGYCQGTDDIIDSPCTPKLCSDAPNTLTSDFECQKYQTGCLTTGKGCVSVLGPCSGYIGTKTTCEEYIGSDGKCQGSDELLDGPCSAKICTETPGSIMTNQACAEYQIGCISNGSGCVSSTSCTNTVNQVSCNLTANCTWNNVCVGSVSCSDFLVVSICLANKAGIGSNTKPCYWTGSSCRDLKCTDAPVTHDTDSLCDTFLPGCLTNGNGCFPPSTPCSSYNGTQIICAAYTRKCWNTSTATSSTACTERQCLHNTTSTSDSECDNFKAGCVTKGTGCIDPASPCNAYQGTQSQCDSFRGSNGTIRCYNTSAATSATPCTIKQCSDNTTSTTDTECHTFLSGCVRNGIGCLSKSDPCTSYTGTRNQCAAFKGLNGTQQCWFQSLIGSFPCVEKACHHAPHILTTDVACNNFLAGCLTNGAGCLTSISDCSQYSGTPAQCATYTGNGQKCYKAQLCDDRSCSDKSTAIDDNECTSYLSTCRYFKGACTLAGICTSYPGTSLDDCMDVLDNNLPPLKCWWVTGNPTCIPRSCSNAPKSVKSQIDCDSHTLGCFYNYNNECVDQQKSCSSYVAHGIDDIEKAQYCDNLSNKEGISCWFIVGDDNCIDKSCANVPPPIVDQSSCDDHKSNCQFFENTCIDQGPCNTYTVSGTEGEKLTKCQALYNSENKSCYWTTGNNCEETTCNNAYYPINQLSCDTHLPNTCYFNYVCDVRVCKGTKVATSQADCTAWLADCQWLGGFSCADKPLNCSAVNLTFATNAAIKTTVCEGVTTSGGVCQLDSTGTACEIRTCAGASGMTSAISCDTWKANCQWDGVSSCVDKTGTCPSTYTIQSDVTSQSNFCWNFVTFTYGRCKNGPTGCLDRVCQEATGKSSALDCQNYQASCQWDGVSSGSCVPQVSACSSAVYPTATNDGIKQKNFCESYTLQGYSLPTCQASGSACTDRTCNGKTGVNNLNECNKWKITCQWDGIPSGSCVDQSPTCPATASNHYFCEDAQPYDGSKCQINSSNNGCEIRQCQGAIGMNSTSDCNTWLTNCQWNGVPSGSCIPQQSGCLVVAPYPGYLNNFCESLVPFSYSSPVCQSDISNSCTDRNCGGKIGLYSPTNCNNWKPSCQWDGQNTCIPQGSACPTTFGTLDSLHSAQQCNSYLTSSSGRCIWQSGVGCVAKTCAGKTDSIGQSDCSTWMSTCRYDGTSTCINAQSVCSGYNIQQPESTQKTICETITNISNKVCQQTLRCEARTCANKVNPTSNADCSNWIDYCLYDGSGCVVKVAFCSSYSPNGANNAAKRAICTSLSTTGGEYCVYVDNAATCANKDCSNVYPVSVTQSSCEAWLNSCRWIASTCQSAAPCNTITATGIDNLAKLAYCSAILDNSTIPILCTFHSVTSTTQCSSRTCANIPTIPTSDIDCLNYLSTCRVSHTTTATCVDISTDCSGYQGTADQCKTFIGSNGTKPCWSISTTSSPSACITKVCSHNVTATTNIECDNFLTGCKSNGNGCVDGNLTCSDFVGDSTTCLLRKAADGINFCKVGKVVSGPCQGKSCYDDITSTTDEQCKLFMPTCLTRGIGCISNTEPCTSYRGTRAKCALFTGSNGTSKCWNTAIATETSFCFNKQCSDDTISTTDIACAASGDQCITKGVGCTVKTAACSSFTGTQKICASFLGNNKTVPCWNTETATITTPCVVKVCTHNTTSTTDAECSNFLVSQTASPVCITNGQGCVSYPKTCSEFTGTTEQCGKFTATDGPCKSTVFAGSGPCTPRICSEALNVYDTDALCKAYHPTCLTTGYGCSTSGSCSQALDQLSCVSKIGCSWVYQCKDLEPNCEALTPYEASACRNTPVATGQKCAWYNDTCRVVTCSDLSSILRTHEDCQRQISTCTTTGQGCITMGACDTYYTETICKSAQTTDLGGTCIWDSLVCRSKKCTDAEILTGTDQECDSYLSGCKTNGLTCISSMFECPELKTEIVCVKDGSNKPCLWVNGLCYSYSKCEDIPYITHADCQVVSPLCTTDGTKCIPITLCEKFKLQVSCAIGIDGTCGWLPAMGEDLPKCQKFVACSDAVSSDRETCQEYNSICFTDGNNCLGKKECKEYTTEIACKENGIDGICFFSEDLCRLRECTDASEINAAQITTHFGCSAFSAKDKCTTNGTSCIPISTCSSYKVQAGCVTGTDGVCTWVEKTLSCRLRTCKEFILTTSVACTKAAGTQCISNGIQCIDKSTCSSYTSKEACNVGGTDGVCAFTPGETSNSGSCKLMTQCSDANNDSVACATKSGVCNWKVTTSQSSTTSECSHHTCATLAKGSICNPIPSFDGKIYSLCVITPIGCSLGEGNHLTDTTCYEKSMGTYSWNSESSECNACFKRSSSKDSNSDGTTTISTYIEIINVMGIALVFSILII